MAIKSKDSDMRKIVKRTCVLIKNEIINRYKARGAGKHDFWEKGASDDKGLDAIPVIMCCWSRINLLESTLDCLNRQVDANIELHLWNNNLDYIDKIKSIVQASDFSGKVCVYNSHRNVGGFGRFYIAKNLAEYQGYAITIDDDQHFGVGFIAGLYGEREEKTIKGDFSFAFVDHKSYWAKNLVEPEQVADYCGTGGAVFDLSLFLSPKIFSCPKRYWFVEDLWACVVAKKAGWMVKRSRTQFEYMHNDGKDQHSKMYQLKNYFLEYLRKKSYL